MDEETADGSPWSRDDWDTPPPQPVEFSSRAADEPLRSGGLATPDTSGAGEAPTSAGEWHLDGQPQGPVAPTARPSDHRRRAITLGAGALVIALLAVFALVNGSDDDRDAAAATTEPDDSGPETTEARTTTTQRPSRPPATSSPATTMLARSFDAVDAEDPTDMIGIVAPELEEIELGSVAEWTSWQIPSVGPLARITTPTEVVILASRAVHRLQLPSGQVESIALIRPFDASGQVAVAGDTVALALYDEVLLIRDGLPTVRVELEAVNSVQGRAAQGDFVVSVTDEDANYRMRTVLVSPDGAVTPVDRPWFDGQLPGGTPSTAAGELLASTPGGIYAAPPGGPTPPRRLVDGYVAGAGRNHLLVQRCDENLACRYELLDLTTEALVPVTTPFDDLSNRNVDWGRVSPDGTRLALATYGPGPPTWGFYDLATGAVLLEFEVDNWFGGSDPWAADGSGIFAADGGAVSLWAIDGTHAEIAGFRSVVGIAVQPSPELG